MWGYSCNHQNKRYLLKTERVVLAEMLPRPLSATHWTMPLSVPVRLFIVSVLLLVRLLSWFLPSSVTITWNLPFWLTFCMLCIHEICGVGNPTAVQLNVVLGWTSSFTGVTTGCGGITVLSDAPSKLRARLIVYWPGLDNDIDNIILTCKQCQEHLPSNPREPITIKPRPGRPFQELAADFCSYASQDFLILVDCYTRTGPMSSTWATIPPHSN